MDSIYSLGSGSSFGNNYYGSYRDMIIDGIRTPWGWISFGEELLKFGIHGLVGAVIFKKIWVRFAPSEVSA